MIGEVLNHYDNLKQNMQESYDKVSLEAKSLLSALQRPPANDTREEKARSRLSDYTEAASHVMEVIVEMYEQNKQLNIQLEKTCRRVHQKYKFYLFEAECDKVCLQVYFFVTFVLVCFICFKSVLLFKILFKRFSKDRICLIISII